jgi:HK97 gp10 family phage protein
VIAPAWYAHFIEWGTAHAGARPFMTPAAEAARPEHRALLEGLYR